ncbi:MAG: MFS transporter [Chloroflexi bacterium]|nr:MFS transporter [Chloroflexota bacterium]
MTERLRSLSGGLSSDYWKLWSSSAASNLADGIFVIALPLIAVRLTDSPVLVAGVAIAGRLPWLLFALIAGALADRLDRLRTMRHVNLLRFAVIGLMAALALLDLLSLPALYIAAFVLGIGETLFDTAAQSIMPSLVGREQLSKANGRLYAAELSMNQFIGPPLGGLLVSLSVPLALSGSALCYVFAAGGLMLIVGDFRPARTGPPTRIHTEVLEGLRYLARHRLLRTLAGMVGLMNLATSAVFAIFALYAVAPGPMGLSEAGFGLLLTTFAVGSVIGSVLVERIERRFGRASVLTLGVLGAGLPLFVPALTTEPILVGAAFAVMGLTLILWNVVTVSLRQRIIPDRLLGRVNSGYRLLAWGTKPLGALLGGVVGQLFGLQAVFILAGAVTLVLLVARATISDEAIDAAEAEGDREASAVA